MNIYSSCKALVIGVDRYADPQYDLGYARSDAEAMAELLGNEFGFNQIWTLYDSDATRQNIRRFFERDLQQVDEDDGIVIFFAGHGITVTSAIGDERGFLVPHDGNPKQPYANISLSSIRDDYLRMIPAKHVFLIIDACYGGLALRDVATVEQPQTIDESIVAELTRRDRKVRQVLAAGTKDQKVLDGGLFGHNIFTGRLIEALREANPYITADHVGVHVCERVSRDSLDRKHRQTPQCGYLIGGGGNFVFCKKGMAHLAAPPSAQRTAVELRTARLTTSVSDDRAPARFMPQLVEKGRRRLLRLPRHKLQLALDDMAVAVATRSQNSEITLDFECWAKTRKKDVLYDIFLSRLEGFLKEAMIRRGLDVTESGNVTVRMSRSEYIRGSSWRIKGRRVWLECSMRSDNRVIWASVLHISDKAMETRQ